MILPHSEGQVESSNDNEDLVCFASTETLIDEFKKRFDTVLLVTRTSEGVPNITYGGANFDVDYAIAMCDRAKAAILDEDREQSSIFYLDLENDDDDDEDDEEEEFAGFDAE